MTTNLPAGVLRGPGRTSPPTRLDEFLSRETLHEVISGEWYTRTLPHPPGQYSGWELVPAVGAAVTVRRMATDEPNLTDKFSGNFLVPVYHVATVSALYNLVHLATRLL